MAAKAIGIDYPELCVRVLESASLDYPERAHG
jgi:hypothetical protein